MTVQNFTKMQNDEGKYDIKLCTEQKGAETCEIHGGYYRLRNKDPANQLFVFPSTKDNSSVFLPERIVEDKRMFKEYVLDAIKNPKTYGSCIDIDPCNVYTNDYCEVCREQQQQQSGPLSQIGLSEQHVSQEEESPRKKEEGDDNVLWIILLSLFMVIFVIALIGIMVYIARRNRSSSYSSSEYLKHYY